MTHPRKSTFRRPRPDSGTGRSQSPRQPTSPTAGEAVGSASSWQAVHQWYDQLVGDKGHYYHQQVILPRVLELLQLRPGDRLLDLACGQGVLARVIPESVSYLGLDVAKSLIQAATSEWRQPSGSSPAAVSRQFLVADLMRPTIPVAAASFTHAAVILALQNMRQPQRLFTHAAQALQPGGKLLIVLNHPCFRIPRQSSWGVDESKKTQYRRIDRYLSPLEIPIQAHPGRANSAVTWSFHFPLSTYINGLSQAGLVVTGFAEWSSDKQSQGKAAKMENRSRVEIPLFAAILAEKRLASG